MSQGAVVLQFRPRPAKVIPVQRPWEADLHIRHPLLVPDGLEADCGIGWSGLVEDLLTSLQRETDSHGAPQLTVLSCGQTWGRLVIEVETTSCGDSAPSQAQSAMIRMAGDVSLRLCEVCGAPGLVRVRHGRHHVRCDAHLTGGVRQTGHQK